MRALRGWMLRRGCAVATVGCAAVAPLAHAQCNEWSHRATFENSGIAPVAPSSLALSEEYLAFGGREGSGIEAVYLRNAQTGDELRRLDPPNLANGVFGAAVAISGSRILVGAPYDDTAAINQGGAYLFDVINGALLQQLFLPPSLAGPAPRAPDAPPPFTPTPTPVHYNDGFGGAVALSPSRALVGAFGTDGGGRHDAGSAHLFDAETGLWLRSFEAPDPSAAYLFGWSVAISGEHLLIGAPSHYADSGPTLPGKAFLFDAQTGGLIRDFESPSPTVPDAFGNSVAISEGRVLIASEGADKVYLFDEATGSLLRTIAIAEPTFDYRFGFSASMQGDRALVGQPGFYDSRAYLFDLSTGLLLATFPTSDTPLLPDASYFGRAVAMSSRGIAAASFGAIHLFGCPDAPIFVVHPASQTANPGQKVALSALAAGTGPIAYQWFKDGAQLEGRTAATLELAAAAASDAGLYRCDASNAGGTAASNAASLAILEPPGANAAEFVGTTVPTGMEPAERLNVGVMFHDTSPLSWSAAQGYSLAVIHDPSGVFRGAERLGLASPQEVVAQEGGIAQFVAMIQAPAAPGVYEAKVRMVEEFVEFFGETGTITVNVVAARNGADGWARYD